MGNDRQHDVSGTEFKTLADLAPVAARRNGSDVFLELWSSRRGNRQSLTFVEFDQWVAVACHHVRQVLFSGPSASIAGVRVALIAHVSADSLAMSLAVPTLSAVLVQLNWRQPESTLATMISGLDCSMLVVGRGFVSKARRLRAQSGVPTLVVIDDACAEEPSDVDPSSGEYSVSCDPARLRAESPATAAAIAAHAGGSTHAAAAHDHDHHQRPEPSDVAAIMFTSGTSALPKPVPLTHKGLLWSCRAKREAERSVLGISDGEHRGTLAFLPAFHVIGFTNKCAPPPRRRARSCL